MRIFIIKLVLSICIVLIIDHALSLYLKKGIDAYYGLNKKAKVVFIGHSRTEMGVDSDIVQNILNSSVTKYAVSGTNIYTHLAMIKHYIDYDVTNKPAVIILNVDKNYLAARSPSSNDYTLFYPYMNDKGIDEYIYSNVNDKFGYYSRDIFKLLRYVELKNNSIRGILGKVKNYDWSLDAAKAKEEYKSAPTDKLDCDPKTISVLSQIIDLCRQRKVKLILIDIPNVDFISSNNKYEKIISAIAINNGIHYINISDQFTANYNLFYDENHLNTKGRTLFSQKIALEIKNILGKQ